MTGLMTVTLGPSLGLRGSEARALSPLSLLAREREAGSTLAGQRVRVPLELLVPSVRSETAPHEPFAGGRVCGRV